MSDPGDPSPAPQEKSGRHSTLNPSFTDIYKDDDSLPLPTEDTNMINAIKSRDNERGKSFPEMCKTVDAKSMKYKDIETGETEPPCGPKDQNDLEKAPKAEEDHSTLNIDPEWVERRKENSSSLGSDINPTKVELDQNSNNTTSSGDYEPELDINCRPGRNNGASETLRPNLSGTRGMNYLEYGPLDQEAFKSHINSNHTIESQLCKNTLEEQKPDKRVFENNESNNKTYTDPSLAVQPSSDSGHAERTTSGSTSNMFLEDVEEGCASAGQGKGIPPFTGEELGCDRSPIKWKNGSLSDGTQLDSDVNGVPANAMPKENSLFSQPTPSGTNGDESQNPTMLNPDPKKTLASKTSMGPEMNSEIEEVDYSITVPKTVNGVDDNMSPAQGLDIPASPGYVHNTNSPEGIELDSDANNPLTEPEDEDGHAISSGTDDNKLQNFTELIPKPNVVCNKTPLDPQRKGITEDFSIGIPQTCFANTSAGQRLVSPTSRDNQLDTDSTQNTSSQGWKLDTDSSSHTRIEDRSSISGQSHIPDIVDCEPYQPTPEEPNSVSKSQVPENKAFEELGVSSRNGSNNEVEGNASEAQGLAIHPSSEKMPDNVVSSNNSVRKLEGSMTKKNKSAKREFRNKSVKKQNKLGVGEKISMEDILQHFAGSLKSNMEWVTAWITVTLVSFLLYIRGNERNGRKCLKKRKLKDDGRTMKIHPCERRSTTGMGHTSYGNMPGVGKMNCFAGTVKIFIAIMQFGINVSSANPTPIPPTHEEWTFCTSGDTLINQTVTIKDSTDILQPGCSFNFPNALPQPCPDFPFYICPVNATCLRMRTRDQAKSWMLEYGKKKKWKQHSWSSWRAGD